MAPGSVALETIYQRLEAAEGELKRLQELQETCREAVERLVRTSSPTGSAASTASVPLGQVEEEELLMVNEGGQEEDVTIVAVTGDGKVDIAEQGDGPRITITTVKSIETTTTGTTTTTPTKNGKAKKSTPPR